MGQTRTPEARAAAVVLGAYALRETFATKAGVGAKWLSVIMRPEALRDAVAKAQKSRGDEFSYVTLTKDPPLWALLQASNLERDDESAAININLDRLAAKLLPFARVGIADDANQPASADAVHTLQVPVQSLYRHWKLRDAELDRIRPFFNDPRTRSRIRPLEVEIRPVRVEAARNAKAGKSAPAATDDGPRKTSTLALKHPRPGR